MRALRGVGCPCQTAPVGKSSRRESRRNRPKPVRYVDANSQLRVVVVTQPTGARGVPVDLSHDVTLVKAALLYADHVELVSPGAAMVTSAGGLQAATPADAIGLLGTLDPATLAHLGGKNLPDNFAQMVQGALVLSQMPIDQVRRILGKEVSDEFLADLRAQLEALQGPTRQLREVAAGLVDGSGLRELDDPVRLELVTLRSVGIEGGSTDAVLASYVNHLKNLLRDPVVHALFDESTASLARSLAREQHVEPNRLTLVHARQAAVGGGLVTRLPSFPDAEMGQVLALRSDLSGPLRRYRRSVAALAGKLQAQAYDEDSSAEIDDLWRTDVAPTLDELRDGLAEHSYIRHLARQIATSPTAITAGVASAGALFMGMHSLAGLDAVLASVGGVTPAATALAHHGVQAAVTRGGARDELRRHDLYYLHEVNQRLRQH